MERQQQTLKDEISIEGVGLHTGAPSTLTLRPAPVGAGRICRLSGPTGVVEIQLIPANVESYMHRTVARGCGMMIHTVEHILAALTACGVDNVYLDLSAPEPPGMDGSCKPLVEAILKTGLHDQKERTSFITIESPIVVEDGNGGSIRALPPIDGFRVSYTLSYPESKLACGTVEMEISPNVFASEIAPARTFCMESQVEAMRAAGCGLGANYENTVVLRENEVVQTELRFSNEPARHKILDLVGDLGVLGRPMCMYVVAERSGHELNLALMRKIAEATVR